MKKIIISMLLAPFLISSCGSSKEPSRNVYLSSENTIKAHYLGYGRMSASIEEGGEYNLIVATATYDASEDIGDQERITVRLQETLEYVSTSKLGYKLTSNDINDKKNYINTLFNVTDATRDTSNYIFKDDTGSYEYMKFETGVAIPAQEAFAALDCKRISSLVFDVTKKDGSSNEGISGATGTDIDQVNPGNADNWSLYLAALQDVAVKACDTFKK